jgi:hypothetical protein
MGRKGETEGEQLREQHLISPTAVTCVRWCFNPHSICICTGMCACVTVCVCVRARECVHVTSKAKSHSSVEEEATL